MNSKFILFLVIAVAILGALFLIFRSQSSNQNNGNISNEKVFTLEIKDKKIVMGSQTLKVTEGDNVIIKITSDEPEEFHLHGYDRSVDLNKDVQVQLSFLANHTGRFVFELEYSKIELGALEVQPK